MQCPSELKVQITSQPSKLSKLLSLRRDTIRTTTRMKIMGRKERKLKMEI
jgi:hypothetical protein